ncbi:MAG: redoxin domain-containing protein [bacterium]
MTAIRQHQQQRYLVLAALVLGMVVVVFQAFTKPPPASRDIQGIKNYMEASARWQGKFPPDFTLTLRTGESFHLAEHIGREVIVLNFFTTWCGPCKEEMPELQVFIQKHHGEPVVLLGVNVDEKPEVVDAYRAQMKLQFPVGIDTNRVVADQFGVSSYPTTVLIGSDGRVGLFTIGEIANADVVLEPPVRQQLELLAQHKGITRADYEAGAKTQALQPVVSRHSSEPAKASEVKLDASAQAFANRIKCPSCGGALFSCSCNLCESVKKKLATVTVTNRTDEQILHDLFLEGKQP